MFIDTLAAVKLNRSIHNSSKRKYSDRTQWDTVYKLKYTIKTQNYNTKAINIDKTGERGKVLKDRVIQAMEPGSLSDRRENLNKMFFELY